MQQRMTMRGPGSLFWLATTVLGMLFVSSTGHACSMLAPPMSAAVLADGGVVYLVDVGDDEQPGRWALRSYDAFGALTHETPLPLDRIDMRMHIVGVDPQDHLWVRTRCHDHEDDDPLCHAYLHVRLDGVIEDTRAASDDVWPRYDRTLDRFVTEQPENGTLSLHDAFASDDDAPLRRFAVDMPETDPTWHDESWSWTVATDGTAVAVREKAGQVAYARFGRDGGRTHEAMFEAAASGRHLKPADEIFLGSTGRIEIADDGTIYAGQYAYGADCQAYQPPSIAILDDTLSLIKVATVPEAFDSWRLVGEEVVVIAEYGDVHRFTREGELIGTWKPPFDIWRPNEPNAAREAGGVEARQARAAAMTAEDDPETWVALLSWVPWPKRETVTGWMVEAGPAALATADDALWRELGPALCTRHPETAAREVERRFLRSRGSAKARWLEMMVTCHEEPEPQAMAYASSLIGQGETYLEAARNVWDAWGYPPELVEPMWATLAEHADAYPERYSVLYAFDQTRSGFEARLRSPDEVERALARQLLLDSIDLLQDRWSRDRGEVRTARAEILRAAEAWSTDPSPDVATAGRLLLIGHSRVDVAKAITASIEDAEREPSWWPWLGWTVGQVVHDQDTFDRLPRDAVQALLSHAIRHPTSGRLRLEHKRPNPDHPFDWLIRFGGARAIEPLDDAARAPDASSALRSELLRRVTAYPWYLAPSRLARLLDAPWLRSNALSGPAQRFFVRLDQALAGVPAAREAVRARLRRFLIRDPECGACSLGQQHELYYESDVLSSLTPEDVAPWIDAAGGDLDRWLWLLAVTGGWPEIEPELEALLDQPHNVGIEAARALAPMRHPRALEVLLLQLDRWGSIPAEAFAPYGHAARERLQAHLFSLNPTGKENARRALTRLGIDPALGEKLWAEAEAASADGRLPTGDTARLLHGQGFPVFAHMLSALATKTPADLTQAVLSFELDAAFAQAFGRWAAEDPGRQRKADPVIAALHPSARPGVLDWGAQLAEQLATLP